MSNDEILKSKKVFAEFTGWTIEKGMENESNPYYNQEYKAGFIPQMIMLSDFPYNTSWDWLMPVWSKCIEVIGVYMHTHGDNNVTKLWLEKSHEIANFISAVDIRSAFFKIGYLIQWYNAESQTK